MKPMRLVVPLLAGLSMFGAAPGLLAPQENSVRAALRSLQMEIDELREQLAASKFEVIFRDLQRTLVLAPGETAVVALTCQDGEVIVTGGYNSAPLEVLDVVLNGPFFDGFHSGWRVDFHNPTAETTTVNVRLTQECTKGTGRGE